MNTLRTLKRGLWPYYHRPVDWLRPFYRGAVYRLFGIDQRRLLFIACFPKSGSTYLMRLLCAITGFPKVFPVQFAGPNEHDFFEKELRRLRHMNGVCHQHLKGTLYNVKLAKEHNLRIVVLVRNIFDVVVSLNEHFHNESKHFPTGYVPREFFEMPQEDQWMFLIRVHMPWLFSFLMSWHEAQEEVPVLWLTYERLFAEQIEVTKELLGFWEMPVDEELIRQSIEVIKTRHTRLNKGVPGRGQTLPEAHRQAICELADACKLDATLRRRIGLPPRRTPVGGAQADSPGRVD